VIGEGITPFLPSRPARGRSARACKRAEEARPWRLRCGVRGAHGRQTRCPSSASTLH